MKILFVINTLAYPGGAERVISVLGNAFSKTNNVYFITSWAVDNEYQLNYNIERVNIFDSRPTNLSKIKKNNISIKFMRNFIKKNKIDVVVSFCTENNLRMMLATLGLKCKKIVSIRNNPEYEFPNIIYKIVNYLLFLSVNHIVFQTKDAQDFFPKFIRNKGKIIFNPIDDKFFQPSTEIRKNTIVSVGRFAKQKNNILLLKAFNKIKDDTDYILEFYGNGENEELLKSYVKENNLENRVFIYPKSNNVKRIYDKSKIFVLTSDFEGMPNSLMEAMASGLAVISTDCPCGGPKVLINNYSNGILIPVGDIDLLSTSLLKIINDETLRETLMCNAKYSSDFYTVENIVKQWETIIY